MGSAIRRLDVDALRREYLSASPYRHFAIDEFLEESFLKEVVAAYPDYESARHLGREFNALNERLKVQITNSELFPQAVRALNDELSSPAFLRDLSAITGIDDLQSDALLAGGGMHLTGAGGRLDVHVDFNLIEDRKLHRRLNILVYLNERWCIDWGGELELWDPDVRQCVRSFAPIANRCVVFETSEISFHGVTPVRCPNGVLRKSFAAYYYTSEPPLGWDGTSHSTVFKARPTERVRGSLLMPLSRALHEAGTVARRVKRRIGALLR